MIRRLIERLLARCLPPGPVGRSILGDLHEEQARRVPGPRRELRYLAAALGLGARYVLGRTVGASMQGARGLATAIPRGGAQMIEDIRHALRFFRRRPGFLGVTVLTLALGIGATTAIFTVIDTALLRPLPYDEPDELVDVWNTYPAWKGHDVLGRLWNNIALSYPEYELWRDSQEAFSEVAVYSAAPAALTGRGDPREVIVGVASASLFPLLGISPILGRTFTPDEEAFTPKPVAVISHSLWRGRFGGMASALGEELKLNGETFTIIGALPRHFRLRILQAPDGTPPADIWIPVGADGSDLTDDGHHTLEAIGRLAPGVTLAAAVADTEPILRGGRSAEVRGARLTPRVEEERGASRRPLLLLMASVGLLMLVGCINVATVMLGEVTRRRRELATRAALGAGRGRIVRQLLTESMLLGLLGTAAGLFIARGGVALLVGYAPAALNLPPGIAIDLRVLLFCSALGIATGMLFGIVPALAASRSDVQSALRLSAGSARPAGQRMQQALIVGEVALALVLLVSAGLLGRSLAATFAVQPGFVTDDLATLKVSLTGPRYREETAAISFFRELSRRAAALPGVQEVSGSNRLPFSGRMGSSSFEIEGRPTPEGFKGPEAERQTVLPRFHEVMGIPVMAGRGISDRDAPGAPPVVVISESMAGKFWPGESPLGARVLRDGRAWEVVGVVGDVLQSDLRGRELPTFYFPFLQQPVGTMALVVRTRVEPSSLSESLRRTVWALDPALPLDEVGSVQSLVAGSASEERYRTFLLAIFGGVAALLTGVGIFGVTARAVAGRMREFGIRAALGARRGSILGLVIRREATAMIFGLALGVAGALAAGRLLSGFLFGVRTTDPVTFAAAALFLLGLGLLAAYLPARRAARLDPGTVLRSE